MNDEEFYEGMDDIDRQIRISRLRREIEEAGGNTETPDGVDLPPAIEEALLENILFFERAPRTSYAKMLIEDRIELPMSNFIPEDEMHSKMWEVVQGLKNRRVFLTNTNHLSDRELYDYLWTDLLNHDAVDIKDNPSASYHINVIGGGTEDDVETFLRYYADEEDREEWALETPEGELPESEVPPFDRDRFLPRPELP